MVLRLFSKSSSKSDPSAETGPKAKSAGADLAGAQPEELVAAARQATSGKERQAIIAHIKDAPTLKTLAASDGCLAPCADQLAAIDSLEAALTLASSKSAEARIDLALATHNAELRDAQITRLTTEDELVALEHASRSKNKACNRLARARLHKLRKARVTAAEAAAQSKDLASNAQRLEQDAHHAARFDALAQQHAATAERYATSVAVLSEFQEQAPALVAMPEPPQAMAAEDTDQGPDFARLSLSFSDLQKQLEEGTSAERLAEPMKKASADWQAAIASATPDAKSINTVTKSSDLFATLRANESLLAERKEAIDTLLSNTPELTADTITTLKRSELPNAWLARDAASKETKEISELTRQIHYPSTASAPPVVGALAERKQALGKLLDACKSRQASIEDEFIQQVKRLDKALEDGELKRAEAARGEARSLQDALPPGAANGSRKRFGALIGNMQNLRDWQHFATDPKREELCSQMQSIADDPKEPDEQAQRVKELRAQWNELGGKGPKEIAAKFDEAASRAFEPCRLHYAKLGEERAKNIETRKGILQQIEDFVSSTDWASADLASARNILNSARKEWRDAFPVERTANKKLEKRFQTATDSLYSKLQEGWSENLAAKETLVTSAEALLTSEDPLPARLDTAKKLQQRWKEAGPVPRGPDQKLWKRFRSACDSLFNTRDEERSANQARFAADQTTANLRLDEFQQLIEKTPASELERSSLGAVKNDLGEIEHLDRDVLNRARSLEDSFMAKLAQKALAVKAQKLSQLKALDVQAAASELAGNPVAEDIAAQAKELAKRLQADDNAHLDLVLQAETEAGIESPASDAQRRLELQVERLNAGMNSGARAAKGGMELVNHWCALKATSESETLRDRLFAAAEALLASEAN